MWAAEGRNAASLQAFFDGLTSEQKASIRAVSIDMSAGYEKTIRGSVPDAQVCFDPFHVCQLASKAADQVRRDEYNQHGRSASSEGKWIKGTRYSLLKDTAKQTAGQLLKLAEVVTANKRMYRAFLLYGELRYLYRLPKNEAAERLDAWLAWASRSKLKPFVKLARTIRQHKQGVLSAIELGISNGRLEALNSKVRLISHRASAHPGSVLFADAAHRGREHHDSLSLVGVELIVPDKHKLGERPPSEITKARIRLVIESVFATLKRQMRMEEHLAKRSPGSRNASPNDSSHSPSACSSTPSSGAHHEHSPPTTADNPHQASSASRHGFPTVADARRCWPASSRMADGSSSARTARPSCATVSCAGTLRPERSRSSRLTRRRSTN